MSLVAGPLSKHPRMSHQDSATVQLVLTFFRNLLEVPDEEQQPGCGPGDGSKKLQVKDGRGLSYQGKTSGRKISTKLHDSCGS